VRHFHVNLNETQDQNIDLINDKNNFINEINENFARLLKKYSPDWSWDPSRYTVKNQNIIDVLSNVYLGKCLLSNVFNFKYYYAKCYVSNAHDLLSPSTTAFIKKVSVIKNKNENVCKKIDLDVPVEEIYKETQNIKKYLYPHRSESGIGWKGFCIHGQKFNRTKEDAYYPDFLGHSWTVEAVNHMPHTIAWLKTLGYNKFQRVRVMCLDPKGFINVHRDGVHGISNAVNIAINHPTHCEFYLQDYGLIEFSPGDAYSIDVSKYHTVVNNSNIPRYHIIIHGDK